MDGALAIDKPVGPTSHDIVARARRVLREPRVGHTGTLDPLATGLLVLVIGRATRLARFLTASDKTYEAEIRLGVATDTYDALGAPAAGRHAGPWPSREEVDRALQAFRGTFLQQPPAYSAKKIGGQRSYAIARARQRRAIDPDPAAANTPVDVEAPALPEPVSVTAHAIDLIACDGDWLALRVDCSAGFYVRSLAHDLGQRLGTGAHLTALRRTRSGAFTLASSLTLDRLEQAPSDAVGALIPLASMLPDLAAVALTAEGVAHAVHGRDLGPGDLLPGRIPNPESPESPITNPQSPESRIPNPESRPKPPIRLLDQAGDLVGLAEPVPGTGLLHPSVVLR